MNGTGSLRPIWWAMRRPASPTCRRRQGSVFKELNGELRVNSKPRRLAGASSSAARSNVAARTGKSQERNQASMRSGPSPMVPVFSISAATDFSGYRVECFSAENRSSSLMQMILHPVSRVTSTRAAPELCIPPGPMPAR